MGLTRTELFAKVMRLDYWATRMQRAGKVLACAAHAVKELEITVTYGLTRESAKTTH
jgi:hypothetical protein